MNNIFLTYANHTHTDGAAAQLYRIYGIYCLAKRYKFRYLHSPLWRVDHQGLEVMRTQLPDQSLVSRLNSFFTITASAEWPSGAHVVEITDPQPGFQHTLTPSALGTDENVVVKITHPHHILDADPGIWSAAESVSPFASLPSWDGQRPLRIAVHVRRGDVHILDTTRILPNSYYIGVMQNLNSILCKINIPFVMEMHSENSDANFTVTPGDFGTYGMDNDFLFEQGRDEFHDFNVINKLNYVFNQETLTSFCNIATSDIIVTSISSFSYLAAILNPKAIVIYYPFFHQPLSPWLVSRLDGNFDGEKLLEALKNQRGGWRKIIRGVRLWNSSILK